MYFTLNGGPLDGHIVAISDQTPPERIRFPVHTDGILQVYRCPSEEDYEERQLFFCPDRLLSAADADQRDHKNWTWSSTNTVDFPDIKKTRDLLSGMYHNPKSPPNGTHF